MKRHFKYRHPIKKCIISLCFLLLILPFGYSQKISQKRKELESKRKELQQKIIETRRFLNINKEQQGEKVQQLNMLSGQIRVRENLINNLNQEIFEISLDIDDNRNSIETLSADLQKLKSDYADNIVVAYKTRNSLDRITFLFNSKNFNQAFRRMRYLNQLNNYREQQSKLIINTQNQIIQMLNRMIDNKKQKSVLAGIHEEEKSELENDKQQEAKLLQQLKKKEGVLQQQLKENEIASRKLKQAIADLIAKEIEEARKKEEARRLALNKTNKSNKTKSSESRMISPELIKLSNEFGGNMGKLPWPIDRGYIAEHFGIHEHVSLKGVKVSNNGVNIASPIDAPVHAVFKGTVKAVFQVPGMENVILVNHGEFFTVYANLKDIKVKKGQVLTAKDIIGNVHTRTEDSKTELHFEIYQGSQKMDPELWLRR